MERIEISSDINLADIAKHVAQQGVSVELSEGEIPLARIVPIETPHTMSELEKALRDCARLGEDAHQFAQDVMASRLSLGELDDPWEL